MKQQSLVPLKPNADFAASSLGLQRKCACEAHGNTCGRCAPETESLQRKGTNVEGALDLVPPIVNEVLASSGWPLDHSTQMLMERHFGHDFSQVRIHTDSRAEKASNAVWAKAYTMGNDVVFGQGLYMPGSADGKRLLAHELAHVVQQASVSNAAAATAATAESDADHAADTVVSGGRVQVSAKAPLSVQRAPLSDAEVEKLKESTLQQRLVENEQEVKSLPSDASPKLLDALYHERKTLVAVLTQIRGPGDPLRGGSSKGPEPSDGFSQMSGRRSVDPLEGGSSKGPEPADGGFSQMPGGRSVDPLKGGSSKGPEPADGGFSQMPGGRSVDPLKGGSSQQDPYEGGVSPGDNGASRAPKHPDEGGVSDPQSFLCQRAHESAAYKQAKRKEQELRLDLDAAKIAWRQAEKFFGLDVFKGGTVDPTAFPKSEWEVQLKKAQYDSAFLKHCHAIQDIGQALKDAGCTQFPDVSCDSTDK